MPRKFRGALRRAVSACALAAVLAPLAPALSPDAASAALIPNGSFETSTSGWVGYKAALTRAALSDAPHGRYVVKVRRNQSGATFALDDSPAAVASSSAGESLKAQAYVKAASPSSVGKAAVLNIRERKNGSVLKVTVASTTLTRAFKPLKVSAVARQSGSTLEVYVHQRAAASGDAFYADAVSATRSSSGAAEPPPASLSSTSSSHLFSGDYETGDLSQWNEVRRRATDRIRVVGSPARNGRYAARFEVRPGDLRTSAGERAEVARHWAGQEGHGQDYYYSFSMYLPTGWAQEQDGFRIPIQWHSVNSQLNGKSPPPPLAFAFLPRRERPNGMGQGGLYADMRGGNLTRPAVTTTKVPVLPLPIRTGIWHDFVVYVYWHRGQGDLKVWHKTSDQRGFTLRAQINDRPNLYYITSPYSSTSKVFVRQGLFRRTHTTRTNVIHHDAYTQSETFAGASAMLP